MMSWYKHKMLLLAVATLCAIGGGPAFGAEVHGKNITITETKFTDEAVEGDAINFTITVQNNEKTSQPAYPLVVLHNSNTQADVEFYGKATTLPPGETGKMVVSVPSAPAGEYKVICIAYDAWDHVADRRDEDTHLQVKAKK